MASSGKPKTTMAKLKREAGLRERRMDKAARKLIRKQGQPYPDRPVDTDSEDLVGVVPTDDALGSVASTGELLIPVVSSAPTADEPTELPDPEPTLGVGL